MKNIIITISFNLLASLLSAQSIYVDYKMITKANSIDKIKPNKEIPLETSKIFEDAFTLINSMKMHLEANKTESLFWGNNVMPIDVNPMVYNLAKIMVDNDKKYYTNIKSGITLKQALAFGEIFLVKDSINSRDWTLSKEQKKIGDYICFKASTTYWVINSAGKFKKDVVAWYSPSISYNFGPKNFSGLPGLILELADDKILYVLDKIKFSSESIKITELKQGTVISSEEFESLHEKAMKLRNNERRKF